MAMDRNTKWQQGQQFKRASDVDVSKETKDNIEKIAVAHLAVGNTDEFMLGINTLNKLQTSAQLGEVLGKLTDVLGKFENEDE
tara:strand:+ start:605 stop:853 length:249 start_codon:yes stop_codon:yes gene_type:complete